MANAERKPTSMQLSRMRNGFTDNEQFAALPRVSEILACFLGKWSFRKFWRFFGSTCCCCECNEAQSLYASQKAAEVDAQAVRSIVRCKCSLFFKEVLAGDSFQILLFNR